MEDKVTYNSDFKEVIKLSVIIAAVISIVLFFKTGTLIHGGYLIIFVHVLIYALVSYYIRKVDRITVDNKNGLIYLAYRKFFKLKLIELRLENTDFELKDRVGSRGSKYKELVFKYGDDNLSIKGGRGGWTNEVIIELFSKISSSKEFNKTPEK